MSAEEFKAYRRGINRRAQQKRRATPRLLADEQVKNERFRRENKRHLIALLGGKCKRCNWKAKNHIEEAAYDFHHRDPSAKSFGIAPCLSHARHRLIPEAMKCDLLCSRCHRIVEAEIDEANKRERKAAYRADQTNWTTRKCATSDRGEERLARVSTEALRLA